VLEDQFIPTVLDVRAADPLARFTTELLGLLHQRGETLSARAVATSRGTTAEIAEFLMLQTINRLEPLFAHYADSGIVHPEELFRVCVSAVGELATFTTPSKRPPALAAYRHDRLRESFEPVIVALRSVLKAVLVQTDTASAWRPWPIATCIPRRPSYWPHVQTCLPKSCDNACRRS
jgi:type VI secretion system protein ImpJ